MIKHYFNKEGIYISVIQALVLLYSIFCSIDYYHKQEVIATTHPIFIKREQIISRGGNRNGVNINILYNNKKYYVGISHSQESDIENTPLYYDTERDQVFTNSETIYSIIVPWSTFLLSFFLWIAIRKRKKYIWAIDSKNKRPQEMSYKGMITWMDGKPFKLWDNCSYYKLTKQEYRAFETILKKELNSSNNTLPYDHYFVQYFGYQKMHMKYVFANLYAYEVHNDQGIIKSKYRTLFNTADAAQGGRNFVQVHINITDKKVELLSINKGTELNYKQTTKK